MNGCIIHGWSIFTPASLDSQIAGVLAGFTFSGIVFLFGRPGPKNTQALGLFCAAFVALGFDSQLFGTVSGGTPDPFCARVWGEEMTAAGMLAVGAMAIITGTSWLLASHLKDESEKSDEPEESPVGPVVNLNRMVPIMAYGVGVAATLLLAVTTYDYLAVVYPKHTPAVIAWSALTTPILVGAASGALAVWRAIRTRGKDDTANAGMSTTAVRFAAYGILVYAVVGPLFTGVVREFGASWWMPPSVTVVIPTIGAGLVFPAILMVALIQAVSPISSGRTGKPRDSALSEPTPTGPPTSNGTPIPTGTPTAAPSASQTSGPTTAAGSA
jgi:hypothetical protein